jgi:hypothetical protein
MAQEKGKMILANLWSNAIVKTTSPARAMRYIYYTNNLAGTKRTIITIETQLT